MHFQLVFLFLWTKMRNVKTRFKHLFQKAWKSSPSTLFAYKVCVTDEEFVISSFYCVSDWRETFFSSLLSGGAYAQCHLALKDWDSPLLLPVFAACQLRENRRLLCCRGVTIAARKLLLLVGFAVQHRPQQTEAQRNTVLSTRWIRTHAGMSPLL